MMMNGRYKVLKQLGDGAFADVFLCQDLKPDSIPRLLFDETLKHLDVMSQEAPDFEFQERDFNLDTDKKLFDWASKQTYIALGNMMTAAALVGIDSCPIEGFHQEKVEKLLQDKFDIDTTKYGLSYMVAFGYRKEDPARPKSRRAFDSIVTWK